jgi:hypothetical protein
LLQVALEQRTKGREGRTGGGKWKPVLELEAFSVLGGQCRCNWRREGESIWRRSGDGRMAMFPSSRAFEDIGMYYLSDGSY